MHFDVVILHDAPPLNTTSPYLSELAGNSVLLLSVEEEDIDAMIKIELFACCCCCCCCYMEGYIYMYIVI